MSWFSDPGTFLNDLKTNPVKTWTNGYTSAATLGNVNNPYQAVTGIGGTPASNAAVNPWTSPSNGYATGSNGSQGGGSQMSPGSPTTPGFSANYDPSQALSPGYQAQVAGNDQGFNAFKAMALSQGPSAWANSAKQSQSAEALNQLDKGAQSVAGSNAGARDALAMQGGMSSGARERIAESGDKNMTDMSQNVNRQENLNNLQIDMNDQQNKIQQLSQLPGMENTMNQNWENVKAQDLSNQVAENQSVNQYNQNMYQQQMAAWGANQQANATANSGKHK